MTKRFIFLALCSLLLAPCSAAEAQQPTKVPRIGFLDSSIASGSTVRLEAFRQELSKLGWIEGNNIAIEYRFAEQNLERLPELVLDLVRRRPADAQRAGNIAHIGFLATVSRSTMSDRVEAFRQGLRDLGYTEGKNIMIEWRFADGKADLLPSLASDLVRLNVALIVTAGSPVTQAARQATSTIPIVMGLDPDPVGNGFVSSLARPGGNVTGLSALSPEISGRQLEILKEVLPKLSKVAVLGSSVRPGNAQTIKETELAAEGLRVRTQYLDVISSNDIDTAFRAARKEHAEALLVLAAPAIRNFQGQVVENAVKNKLPAMYERAEYTAEGGLMSYGASMTGNFRRAATYVDKILKGAKPADLPVEQPTKFELVINLKAAKQIGLTIPPQVLARADRVVR